MERAVSVISINRELPSKILSLIYINREPPSSTVLADLPFCAAPQTKYLGIRMRAYWELQAHQTYFPDSTVARAAAAGADDDTKVKAQTTTAVGSARELRAGAERWSGTSWPEQQVRPAA